MQVKVPIEDNTSIISMLEGGQLSIEKYSHYRQFDHYFYFSKADPDVARLRYREDEFITPDGEVSQVRSRLTLIGEEEREGFDNTVMLSRSRFLAAADRSLRFYQEYFEPTAEVFVNKDRLRWRIVYKSTDFAVNLDRILKPEMPGYFLEIKSRTWSRSDAKRKAGLIAELLALFGVDPQMAEPRDYPHIVAEQP
jgi:5-methylthioadenosine/S-adenosylhomocysteine deaminase